MPGRESETLVDHFHALFDEQPEKSTFRFLVDGEGAPLGMTNAELDLRARTIAATLRERLPAGERALILCPAGLDYVTSFYACLYAGIIAVPVYPPDPAFLKRTLPRLIGVLEDAEPAVILAPRATVALADQFAENAPALRHIAWLAVDDLDPAAADGWRHPGTGGDDIAFLQYTSGSTSRPKGVMVTHTNLLHNMDSIARELFRGDPEQHMVSWLPPFHDLGLIFGLLTPAYAAFPVTFMSPFSFLKRPFRWLKAISDTRATVSGAPNFAFDLAVAKVTEEERATLDLGNWHVALNGAEPVRLESMERFARAFRDSGFRRHVPLPSYGLAEATLVVSTGGPTTEPVWRDLRPAALAADIAVDAGPGDDSRPLVSCGESFADQTVVIADPQTLTRVPEGRVGEIWVSGPSVARGYWRRPRETEETFGARLADTGEGPFLRTGDLGFLDGARLFITGRIKDVVIIAGKNHYPQDIERTVESVDPALRPGCGVAGSRDLDGEERLIVVQEFTGGRARADHERVIAAIRAKVAEEHGLQVFGIALVRPGVVPKTSSGKLQRAACLKSYLEGGLRSVATWRLDEETPAPAAPATTAAPAAPAAPPAPAAPAAPPAPASTPAQAAPPAMSRAELDQWLRQALARAAGVEPGVIDPALPFAGYGLRSVELVTLIGDLEQRLGRTLPTTVVWEYPTAEKLADFLTGDPRPPVPAPAPAAEPAVPAPAVPGTPEPVAIVGIGCRFPGGVDGPESFWRLLREGRHAVTEVPADRWSIEDYTAEDPATPGRTNSRWGGFLDGVDQFDPRFFGIPPQEAARMDPQQRLLAEVAHEALENAGLPADRLAGSRTGVFIGISSFDYGTRQLTELDAIDAYTGTGSVLSIAANRLSYLLDLRGPSMAVDTACSSSLVAVLQACDSLAKGDCDLALAGGVNLVLSPALAINFSKAGVMSADGRCKSFDAGADGYVRSEGAGVVVLKPLSRALADGDPIHGVIRGGAVNQDGASNGMMAPNPRAQEEVLRAAHARAGVRPEQVHYVEAHGSGTILGDPIEAKALGAVLAEGRDPARPCLIGSVKTNLGHMEAAAGIGGLIKATLMVRERTVAPSLHYERPNPHIPFGELSLRVADTLQPWPVPEDPAVAGVSSFGFGGTNAHLVVEEPPRPAAADGSGHHGAVALTVSARDERALRDLAARYEARLADPEPGLTPHALASAAALRRAHYEHRLAAVGGTLPELRAALAAFGRGEQAAGLFAGTGRTGWRPRPAFVFSGQGPRWWPLAADLLDTEPVFRGVLERCDALLRRHTDWSLLDQLTADRAASRLLDTAVGQPALCAVQIALAALWRSWGVEPAAVVGHSVGEIAAAHVSGALALEDALVIALQRGRALHAATGKGRMAVAGVTLDRAHEILAERKPGPVWVAASNSPGSTVFSGEETALENLAKALEADGVYCRVLESVEFASHSPLMEPVAGELWRLLTGLAPRAAAIPMISTVTGEAIDGDRLDAEYWALNLTRPVRFDAAVTALADAGHDVFVEISPHPMLDGAVTERLSLQPDAADGVVVASLRRDEPGRAALLGELGRLYSAGFPLEWARVHGPAAPMVDLPTYPWQRERCWSGDATRRRHPAHDGHPVLASFVRSAAEPRALHWSAPVDLEGFGYLRDHVVGGTAVLPASLVLDAALAAAREALGDPAATVENVRLTRMTMVPETAAAPTLQLVLFPETPDTGSFRLFTRGGEDDDWTEAAQGAYRRPRPGTGTGEGTGTGTGTGEGVPTGGPLDAARDRCSLDTPPDPYYAALHGAGLQYGPAFQGIERLWRGEREAVARLRARADLTADRAPYLIHPALLDSALQPLVAALGAADTWSRATYLPVRTGRFTLAGDRAAAARWAHAEAGTAEPGADEITDARVTLYDDSGAVVGAVTGIALRRLDPADSADPVGETLFAVEWRVADAAPPATADPGRWLLLADHGGVCDGLAAALAARGGSSVTVTPGPEYRRLGPDRYEIDPARREDLAALLTALRAAGPAPAGVVHGWTLDVQLPGDAGPEELATARDAACLPVLHLVQELASEQDQDQEQDRDRDRDREADPVGGAAPRLVLLTRGAQPVAAGEDIALGQASLWGLARTIGLEHGALRPLTVDLDPARPGDEAAALVAELLRGGDDGDDGGGDGDQVALRGGGRLTPALQPWTATAGPAGADLRRRAFDPARDGNHRLLAARPGSLDSLTPTRWERTPPGPGQVEIEIAAAGLNFSDVLKAMDAYPGAPSGIVPLGAECAGRVSAVGEGVDRFRAGDLVMAAAPGGMAAYVTVAADLVAPRPDGLSDEQAAAVPIAYLTAVYGLEYLARLRRGETVLVHSATGGVGLAALQIARRRGAAVFATAGTDEKRELLRSLGAAHVMDSRSLRFADEIRELTGGRGVDVVLNSAAGEALLRGLELLAPGGRFVEIGKRDIYDDSHIGLGLLKHNRSFFAVDLERSIREQPDLIAELFEEVVRGHERGEFGALPVTTYPYAEAGAAFARMAQARHIGKLVLRPGEREEIAARPDAPPVHREATYLITGGLGALGLETARYLAGQGARHLVLVGRGAPSPDARRAVEELRTTAEVAVVAADISRPDGVAAVLAEIDRSLPPLAGIVHAAGTLDDGLLTDLDAARFRSVAEPKAAGAWHLHRATLDRELDFFVLYSSAAAVLGSAGQANYAAANAFLDALAHHRRARGLPALSVNWGPWAEIGLAARPGRGGALAARGIVSLSPHDGIRALDRLLRGAATQAGVLPLDREALRETARTGRPPGLLGTLPDARGDGPGDGPETDGPRRLGEVRRKLLAVEPGRRRRAILVEHCRAQAARVISLEPSRIDPTAPLAGMGFDSLMSLELRKGLEASLRIELPSTITWRFPTIDTLVPFLAERMEIPLEAGPPPAASEAPRADDAPPPDLDGLSVPELEALLLAKTKQIDEGGQR
ncbi:SDR family NAD(P)-dependent oxidoreductase [Streptomyces sp. NBC_01803]|uniref:SDR family NAD(P)-dependent oxidoreductase n=1 Tax=Streptomyces sp. NBC_01803 TaxID=2975946 RepID=UPI002DDC63B4|nr:SDR family NAD(P)-dependent oxidoreductase [Streptomyces sp. NBC_01803]WSA43066.1 SDR family NAD(P)-dependent oxidoreductase [Streptomyces sp. NBC_01803]